MAINTDVLNPLDDTLTYDPAAQAVWRKCAGDFGTLANIPPQIESLSNGLFGSIQRNEGDTRLSQKGKAENDAQFRNVYLTAIENLRRDAETARTNILQVTAPILGDSGFIKSGDPAKQGAIIERVRDAWTRVQWQLDATDSPSAKLTKALDLAKEVAVYDDEFTMSALRQNLRAYLASKGLHHSPEEMAAQLNVVMAPAVSPAMRAAMLIQQDLTVGWPQVQMLLQQALNFGKASRFNMYSVSGLPGWPRQSNVQIG